MNAIPAQFINTFDDILNVDYKELMKQFLMQTVTFAAILIGVTVWIANRVLSWYRNGGEELIAKVSQTVWTFVITWAPKVWQSIVTLWQWIQRERVLLGLAIPE